MRLASNISHQVRELRLRLRDATALSKFTPMSIPESAVTRVGVRAAVHRVVAGVAIHVVVADIAVQDVITLAADQKIVAEPPLMVSCMLELANPRQSIVSLPPTRLKKSCRWQARCC